MQCVPLKSLKFLNLFIFCSISLTIQAPHCLTPFRTVELLKYIIKYFGISLPKKYFVVNLRFETYHLVSLYMHC